MDGLGILRQTKAPSGSRANMNMNLFISEPNFVFQISHPPEKVKKWFCIKNLRIDFGFQETILMGQSHKIMIRQV